MNRLINSNNKINPKFRKVLINYPELELEVISKTSFFPIEVTLSERLHCISKNIYSIPICIICNKNKKYYKKSGSYSETCGKECLGILKANKTIPKLTQKDASGRSVSQIASDKANKTKIERNIKVNTDHLRSPEVQQKIKNSLNSPETKQKLSARSKKYHEKFNDSTPEYWERMNKIRTTRELQGQWLPEYLQNDHRRYSRKVRHITAKQDISKLPNFENRGLGQYHLDHIIPTAIGFKYNIPPELIGNISNLQFLTEHENCSKQHRKYSEELLEEMLKKSLSF